LKWDLGTKREGFEVKLIWILTHLQMNTADHQHTQRLSEFKMATCASVASGKVWLSDGAHSARLIPLGIPLTPDAADSDEVLSLRHSVPPNSV
jgi:hypothetical protein